MKNEIFVDSTVVNFYKKSFICMAVNSESAIADPLKLRLRNKFVVKSVPTFAFLDSDENLLYCTSGEFKKEEFISEGKNALLPENQIVNLKAKFFADNTNADNCLKYIIALRKAGLDATNIAENYLKTKPEKERFTELNWRIFANGITNFDSDEFQFIVKNKEAFAKVASPTRVEKKIAFIVSETFKNYSDNLDTINYYKRRSIAQAFQIRKVDSLVFRYDIQIYEQTKNWKAYQKTTVDNVEKFAWKDPVLLTDISFVYLEFINDKKGLTNAVNWCKQAIALSPSLDKYVTVSKLLLKIKDYKQALEFANTGKNMATNNGWKTEDVDNLLLEIKKHS